MSEHLVHSFPSVAGPDAQWLVLGSMPGVASLEAVAYYAHPRNAFWPIMSDLFGAGPELSYAERCDRIRSARVAVWDVLRCCRRSGSLDSAIEPASEKANDFVGFFRAHPSVGAVLFNGQKAETAFKRHVIPQLDAAGIARLRYWRLPSTSPANASRNLQQKQDAWRAAFREAGADV